MNKYSYMRCYAIPKSTIKRCGYSSKNKKHLCGIHFNEIKKTKKMTLYTGSKVKYTNDYRINTITSPIKTWKEINYTIYRKDSNKKILEEAKLVRTGSYKDIYPALIKTGLFEDEKHVLGFFDSTKHKKLKGLTLERARHYYSVINYFKRNEEKLKKIQILIKMKIKYKNNTNSITKIQKWYRHRKWIKSLPVSPLVIRKHYMPNINKIIFLQRKFKEFIQVKVRHSYRCPYSQEDYWDIPFKYRECYKYKINNITFWRYYDIRWLHIDFLRQSDNKRFLIEPITKEEFPEYFIKKVSKKIWNLTRKTNEWSLDEKLTDYEIQKDWNHSFKRRSFYCFNMMLLDMQELLCYKFNEKIMWRTESTKLKYQLFYLQVMPILNNIITSTNRYYRVNELVYYYTRDLLKLENVFESASTVDEIAGNAMYGILRILLEIKNTNINQIMLSIITEHFKTIF